MAKTPKSKSKTTTEEPLEKQLWKTADKLRKNIDAAEYYKIDLASRDGSRPVPTGQADGLLKLLRIQNN